MEVNQLPPNSVEVSMEVNLLRWKPPWKLVETSVQVDRQCEILQRALNIRLLLLALLLNGADLYVPTLYQI